MIYWVILASFMLCISLLPWAMTGAERVGLVDDPTERKRHDRSVPLVGGICIYLAFLLSLLVSPWAVPWTMMGWLGLVLVIGVVDDYADISHRIRLVSHAVIVVGIFLTESAYVSNIGAIAGNGDIRFVGVVAVFFTIIGVLGAVNAVNMSDGVDGLLTSLIVISLLAVLFVTRNVSPDHTTIISKAGVCSVVGACTAFLVLNSRVYVKKAMAFLGDAGSTTLGFILVYVLIQYTQGPNPAFSATLAGWVLGLPLLDSSAVILGRVFSGKSPVKADRSHLHHLLMDNGHSVNRTVLFMCGIHSSMICLAVLIDSSGLQGSDAILFWAFVSLVAVRIVACKKIFHARTPVKTSLVVSATNPSVAEITGISDTEVKRSAKSGRELRPL